RRAIELAAQLAEISITLRDPPQEEVGVRAHAGGRVGAQRRHPAGPVLHDVGERFLAGDPLFDRKSSPGWIDLVERVGNVLAAHQQDGSSDNASRSDLGVWSA